MDVFWPGYTYPNFEEVIMELGNLADIHPFFGTWDDMGQPNFTQINTILNDFSDSVAVFVNANPNMSKFCTGSRGSSILLWSVRASWCCPREELIKPLSHLYLWLPPDYPSPKETMRLYAGIFTDCFHLSADAYLTFFQFKLKSITRKR